MIESGSDLDFAKESIGPERRRELGMKNLECDGSIVFSVLREIDCGHAPAPELALDLVLV